MKQRTIRRPVSIKGIGVHTGAKVTATFIPAVENFGVRFVRKDLNQEVMLFADVSKVTSTIRGTTIKEGEATISTVEHVLSALMGMGVDNVLIEVDGPELPIMDGSALPFIELLESAGLEDQSAEREFLIIDEPVSYYDEKTGAELVATPNDSFSLTTFIDFDSPVVGKQYASLKEISLYKRDIAPARTFVFLRELENLYDQNLIRGGDLENAVVIVDRMMDEKDLSSLAVKIGKTRVKIEKEGVLSTTELRFLNEPARHKLLDLIGDLSLIGRPIKGKILAFKPGHAANVKFARLLKEKLKIQRRLKGKPRYDPEKSPILDVECIKKYLPHRYPFLFVDKIIELTETLVVGIKNITFNEHVFQGHFPGNPVFPGVLQIEALAQTGGILALSTVENPQEWDTYFIRIENTKFKYKVAPGDTLILKMELLSPVRRGIFQMKGTAYVGNKLVSEGELTAQIIKRKKK